MTGGRRRRERERAERQGRMRRRILRAAMRLFPKQGFPNVTIRKLAAEIGYSPATIYRYFEDKDEIFFALRGEGFARFQRAQESARTAGNRCNGCASMPRRRSNSRWRTPSTTS
jgi:AcrR family transcriptional regulator